MSYGRTRGAGERVLESRHVIGLFLAVILLSGLFFTLGYEMGLHQSEARVSADDLPVKPEPRMVSKPDAVSKRTSKTTPPDSTTDTAAQSSSEWEFYHAGEKGKTENLLKPAPASAPPAKSEPVLVRSPASARPAKGGSKPSNGFAVQGTGYTLQVSATTREADALELAKQLQKRKFPAYVLSPHGDKYYRVQVGPYMDLKAADAARKGLEDAGFNAFVKR
jgi:cell division septation protein DedD